MRAFFTTSFLAGALACAPAHAGQPSSDWTVFADVDLWRASDAIALSDIHDGWSGKIAPRPGRNVALSRGRASLGVSMDQWSLAYEARQEAAVITDSDTLGLLRMYKQREHPTGPFSTPARFRYFNWSAQGPRLGRDVNGPRWNGRALRFHVGLAWYGQPRYRQLDGAASVSYRDNGIYAVVADSVEQNSRATFPFMHGHVSGRGASLSVAADIPLSDSLSLALKVDDLWSRMRWKDLPVIRRSVNSDTISYDSDGYINYSPLLTGLNQELGQSFALPRYGAATLSRRTGNWEYAVQVERFAQVTVPTVSVARPFGWGKVVARAETRFNTVGLGFERANFRALVQTDSLKPARAKAQSVVLSYLHSF